MKKEKTRKNTKLKTKSLLAVVLMIAILISVAYAWLTATDSKENVFTVGNVNVELWEKFDTNNNGKIDENERYNASSKQLTVENVIPGQTILKEPFVKNTGSNDAWIYLTIAIPTASQDQYLEQEDGTLAISNFSPKIIIQCYAIQDGFNNKHNSADIWNDYFDNSIFGPEETNSLNLKNRHELFDSNYCVNEINKEYNDTNWIQLGSCYKAQEDTEGVAYNYYVYGLRNVLQPNATSETTPLFQSVTLFSDIGDAAPLEVVYTDVSGEKLDIQYYETNDLLQLCSVAPKTGTNVSYSIEGTDELAFSGMPVTTNMTINVNYNYVLTPEERGTNLTEANFLAYDIRGNETDGFYAVLVNRSSAPFDSSKMQSIPATINNIEIPGYITINKNEFSGDAFYGSYGGCWDDTSGIVSNMVGFASSSLDSLTIPVKGIDSINDIRTVKKLAIPSSVQWLCDMCNMPYLEKINIPTDCEIIGRVTNSASASGFYGCKNLTEVQMSENLKQIGSLAFYNTNISSITLPNSLQVIDYEAFRHCNISYVNTGYSLLRIGYAAFNGCPLESLKLNNSYNLTTIENYAFCTSNDEAFYQNIGLPNALTEVGNNAFLGWGNILYNTDNISDETAQNMGGFYHNNWIENKMVFQSSTKRELIRVFDDNASVTIPDTVWTIKCTAFGCDLKNMNSVTIPGSVKTIEEGAFDPSLPNFTAVNITDIKAWCSMQFDGFNANPLKIAHNLYINNMPASYLVLTDEIIGVNAFTFQDCTNLQYISFTNKTTMISEYAFFGCKNLQNVSLQYGLTTIKEGAFSGCYSLKDLILPDTISYVGFGAFSGVLNVSFNPTYVGCSGAPWGAQTANGYVENDLVYNDNSKALLLGCAKCAEGIISIPDGVFSISNDVFRNCSKVTEIIVPNSVKDISSDAFGRSQHVIYNGTATGAPWGASYVN